ncbi:MAG: dienelactone hydrolase family protein, partial [Caulobacteraceae bacterium]
ITGFCWGGGLVWRSCAGTRAFKAGVAWYGDLGPEDPNADLGAWQEQLAASLNCPVLGLYGDRDQYISREQIASMQTRLGKARHKSEIIVYPDVGHGFHADYRSGYVKAAAEDAWARMLAWFEANGV